MEAERYIAELTPDRWRSATITPELERLLTRWELVWAEREQVVQSGGKMHRVVKALDDLAVEINGEWWNIFIDGKGDAGLPDTVSAWINSDEFRRRLPAPTEADEYTMAVEVWEFFNDRDA